MGNVSVRVFLVAFDAGEVSAMEQSRLYRLQVLKFHSDRENFVLKKKKYDPYCFRLVFTSKHSAGSMFSFKFLRHRF